MSPHALLSAITVCVLVLCAPRAASAQEFDIGSGGPPSMSGARGGSVSGSAATSQDLVVTANLGDVSPANRNGVVKIVIPVAIRSTRPYQITVSISEAFDANPRAVRASDVGFGVLNLRTLGAGAQICTQSVHSFRAPFENDPATGITLDPRGRASYPSALSNVGVSTVILSGPKLTLAVEGAPLLRAADNGYVFDAVLAIKPQFYAAGTFSVVLTFNISEGPEVPC